MEVLTLIDNVVYGQGLVGEHGLSFLIKINGKKILFDTGQTGAILQNASFLEEDLSEVDAVVLSHGHYDHCGGLESFLKVNTHATIYLKRKAMDEKFSLREGVKKFIGFSLSQPIESYDNPFVFVDSNVEIYPGVILMPNIQTYTNNLVEQNRFYEKTNHQFIHDSFADELFMMIETNQSTHVFTGCSHKGILNILKTAYEASTNGKLDTLSGGMHFTGSLLNELDGHIDELSLFGLKKFYPNHCTGINGYFKLKARYGDQVKYPFTGFRYDL